MDAGEQFRKEREERIRAQGQNAPIKTAADAFRLESVKSLYSYNFSWLSRPIIQYPQDMVAMQEIIWQVRPDLIIETGIAHGGSLIMSASLLAMIEYCDAIEAKQTLDPSKPRRHVLGLDIDIRAHNRKAIEQHPLSNRITMIEGSSVDPKIIAQVHERAAHATKVLVCLDSNHTHEHVLAELEAYAPLTSIDSYCVVFDTIIDEVPGSTYPDRPWEPGNSPKSAAIAYRERLEKQAVLDRSGARLRFEVDRVIDAKVLISVNPEGYLKRVQS